MRCLEEGHDRRLATNTINPTARCWRLKSSAGRERELILVVVGGGHCEELEGRWRGWWRMIINEKMFEILPTN